MGANEKKPGNAAPESSRARAPKQGHLVVAELVSDRAAAPSPFGDDQTFPLPVERLVFWPHRNS